jgi:5-(carboxyamino)imidazole ribonucleotide synthase
MKNLVGPESFGRWPALAAMPGVALHLYGKAEARPGRKLGHATRLLPNGSVSAARDAGALAPA